MPEYIKTAGDVRAGVADRPDDFPVEAWLNGVQCRIYFSAMGESDEVNITVEPNYTCGGTTAVPTP